jgi:predicted homoserine dehydrogenase-like protein
MLYEDLMQRSADSNPIRVAASGAGWMGSGFASQMAQVPGMELSVLIDSDLEKACEVFLATGLDAGDVVEATAVGQAMDVIRKGKRIITDDVNLAAQLESIDVMTDVTPSPASGAETALSAIKHEKDVVLINIEADVTVGRMLKMLAAETGVLYSVSSGDEPGCLMELVEYVKLLGFETIAIGKGKNNPLDPEATPDSVAAAARQANKDAYQTASYVDGSKTMFEMTCAANATGCLPMQRGMVGPEATIDTVTEIFSLKEDGGLVPFAGVVDFVQGASMAGGVFVTARVQDDRIADDLKYLKVGNGRYSTFYRPYHLWFIEAPISIAQAVLYRQKTLVPLDRPVADVLTIAKGDLLPGDRLDEFGGYTFRALMDTVEAASTENALPAGLAPGATILRPIRVGSVITWDDVRLDESTTVVRLRRQQDALTE